MSLQLLQLPSDTSILHCTYDPLSGCAIATGSDRNIYFVNLNNSRSTSSPSKSSQTAIINSAHSERITDCKVNGRLLLTCAEDHSIKVWDPRLLSTQQQASSLNSNNSKPVIQCMAPGPVNTMCLLSEYAVVAGCAMSSCNTAGFSNSLGQDAPIGLYDLRQCKPSTNNGMSICKPLGILGGLHTDDITCVDLIPSNPYACPQQKQALVTCSVDGLVNVIDLDAMVAVSQGMQNVDATETNCIVASANLTDSLAKVWYDTQGSLWIASHTEQLFRIPVECGVDSLPVLGRFTQYGRIGSIAEGADYIIDIQVNKCDNRNCNLFIGNYGGDFLEMDLTAQQASDPISIGQQMQGQHQIYNQASEQSGPFRVKQSSLNGQNAYRHQDVVRCVYKLDSSSMATSYSLLLSGSDDGQLLLWSW